MSVRKRTWAEGKSAWVVDYTDQIGKRHTKTFRKKKDADQYEADVRKDVRDGTHVAKSQSITVSEACNNWIEASKSLDLEQTTIRGYKAEVRLHIVPFLGKVRLSDLTAPLTRKFEDDLIKTGRTRKTATRVLASLSSVLSDAMERGHVARNVAAEMKVKRRASRRGRVAEKRKRKRAIVGIHIPTPQEIAQFISCLVGKWRLFFLLAIFAGLRASELRGLTWGAVDLERGVVNVRQRADRWGRMGPPKSEEAFRTVPLPPILIEGLRDLRGPDSNYNVLIFANGAVNPDTHANIINRHLIPSMILANLIKMTLNKQGEEVVKAKYSGLHCLRHFYAAWCISPKSAGGLGLGPKSVQARLGHSTIQLTMDTYGHLFPPQTNEELEVLAEGETVIMENAVKEALRRSERSSLK